MTGDDRVADGGNPSGSLGPQLSPLIVFNCFVDMPLVLGILFQKTVKGLGWLV